MHTAGPHRRAHAGQLRDAAGLGAQPAQCSGAALRLQAARELRAHAAEAPPAGWRCRGPRVAQHAAGAAEVVDALPHAGAGAQKVGAATGNGAAAAARCCARRCCQSGRPCGSAGALKAGIRPGPGRCCRATQLTQVRQRSSRGHTPGAGAPGVAPISGFRAAAAAASWRKALSSFSSSETSSRCRLASVMRSGTCGRRALLVSVRWPPCCPADTALSPAQPQPGTAPDAP